METPLSIPFDSIEVFPRDLPGGNRGKEGRSFQQDRRPSNAVVVPQTGLPLHPVCDISRVVPGAPLRLKRVFDCIVSTLAVAGLFPLALVVALAIRLESPGPVLFRQTREGIGGRPFRMFKFRTMRAVADNASGAAHSTCRVTRVGAFLRRTSIDELPQLLNVIRGEMSIVGPRPHVPNMFAAGQPYRSLVPYYEHRLAMRPGLTGWAQANGLRGETCDPAKAQARIDHDLAYIQNASIWLDLKIIYLTIRYEFLCGSGS